MKKHMKCLWNKESRRGRQITFEKVVYTKLKKMIDERLKKEENQDHITLTPEEGKVYREFVDIWEHEEAIY